MFRGRGRGRGRNRKKNPPLTFQTISLDKKKIRADYLQVVISVFCGLKKEKTKTFDCSVAVSLFRCVVLSESVIIVGEYKYVIVNKYCIINIVL